MKKFIRFYFILMLSFLIGSCDETDIIQSEGSEISVSINTNGIYYPLSGYGKVSTRTTTLSDNWEEWSTVTLPSGGVKNVPWSNELVSTSIPPDIRKDIKKEDGWELIAHTLNMPDAGANYLFFYNKFTGILKTFYYVEPSYSKVNSTGLWRLEFTNNNRALYFQKKYANDLTVRFLKGTPYVSYITNITSNPSKGFTVGWNCYQIEISYDPDFNVGTLEISPYSINESKINLSADMQSKTNGLIISQTTTSGGWLQELTKGAINLIGGKAVETVADLIGIDEDPNDGEKFLKEISKSGINKIFSGFTGLFSKKDSTTQKINLTTVGTANIEGSITSLATGIINDLSIPINKNFIGTSLGTWTNTEPPTIYIDPYAQLIDVPEGTFPPEEHKYKLPGNYTTRSFVEINPEILPYITRYTVDEEVFGLYDSYHWREILNNSEIDRDLGILIEPNDGYRYFENFSINEKIQGTNLCYPKFNQEFMVYVPWQMCTPPEYLPPERLDMRNKNTWYGRLQLAPQYVIKVTVKMITNLDGEEKTVISTKTFIPRIVWQ